MTDLDHTLFQMLKSIREQTGKYPCPGRVQSLWVETDNKLTEQIILERLQGTAEQERAQQAQEIKKKPPEGSGKIRGL